MNEKTAQVVFWIVHLPLMGLFLVGMWLVFTNWLMWMNPDTPEVLDQ